MVFDPRDSFVYSTSVVQFQAPKLPDVKAQALRSSLLAILLLLPSLLSFVLLDKMDESGKMRGSGAELRIIP